VTGDVTTTGDVTVTTVVYVGKGVAGAVRGNRKYKTKARTVIANIATIVTLVLPRTE
jgi:hypothetical protein